MDIDISHIIVLLTISGTFFETYIVLYQYILTNRQSMNI